MFTLFVAPYVGAWIETKIESEKNSAWFKSHPTWVRGLKLMLLIILQSYPLVAPYVGAWIETRSYAHNYRITNVAPYVGAWIETSL